VENVSLSNLTSTEQDHQIVPMLKHTARLPRMAGPKKWSSKFLSSAPTARAGVFRGCCHRATSLREYLSEFMV